LKRIVILLHAVYTDCSYGRIDAVARHVGFAHVTCTNGLHGM